MECEFCKIKKALVITGYAEHHIDCNGKGKKVILCNYHHRNLHGYIRKRAIEICLNQNPIFFKDITKEYKEKLNGSLKQRVRKT